MKANVDKGYKGMGMEGRVAAWYARNTARDAADFAALAERRRRSPAMDPAHAPGPTMPRREKACHRAATRTPGGAGAVGSTNRSTGNSAAGSSA
jgi:hypothetical protein